MGNVSLSELAALRADFLRAAPDLMADASIEELDRRIAGSAMTGTASAFRSTPCATPAGQRAFSGLAILMGDATPANLDA